MLIVLVPILINKDVFEPSYDDLKSWSETSITCFPGDSDSKELACNAGDLSLIPRSGRSPGEGHSNPLQYSCLENPLDRGTWWAAVYRVAQNGIPMKRFSKEPQDMWDSSDT